MRRTATPVQQNRRSARGFEGSAGDDDAAGVVKGGSHARIVRYRPVQRDPRRLQGAFDVLVIGAGIYGSAIAWDAAQRGLSVALVDRGDVGGGTSFNNAKTVHGGVRSLQRGRIAELRQYVRERRALSRIAPHLVHPLPFLVPTRGHLQRGRAAMGLYFGLYDRLSADRNDGVAPSRQLGASRMLSRDACLAAHPALGDDPAITGGALWHDGQLLSSERMTLAFALSAAAAGAVIANYVEASRLVVRDGRIVGAVLRDRLTSDTIDLEARVVVNAAGPWANRVVQDALGQAAPPLFDALSLAINVIVSPFDARAAVGGLARGRLFFLAPWRQVTVAGTGQFRIDGDPFGAIDIEARVAELVSDLNAAFPAAQLTVDAVRFVHRGLQPSHHSASEEPQIVKDSIIRDHRRDGVQGLASVVGTRYTTARATAEAAVDLTFQLLALGARPCRTATTTLVGGDVGDPVDFAREVERTATALSPGSRPRVARLYGSQWTALEALAAERPDLAEPLAAGCDTIGAEIVHAVREEMAVTLEDALLRRSDAGSAGHPGKDALARAAALMAAELRWTPEVTREQIAQVERRYQI
jgi:glycerol-3-phosphate dehydrogenase